jgi:hypothetical protein
MITVVLNSIKYLVSPHLQLIGDNISCLSVLMIIYHNGAILFLLHTMCRALFKKYAPKIILMDDANPISKIRGHRQLLCELGTCRQLIHKQRALLSEKTATRAVQGAAH